MPESEASTWGRIGAHMSWAKTEDRSARTAPARAALDQKFLDQADGDPVRAAHLRKAYYARLALKSAQARAARKPTGCPCGCLNGIDCASDRPVPDRDAHACCGALGFDELRAAAERGIHCAAGCVRARLGGAT